MRQAWPPPANRQYAEQTVPADVRWIVGLAAELELGTAEAAVLQVQGRGESLRVTRLAAVAGPLVCPGEKPARPEQLGFEAHQLALLMPVWLQRLLQLIHQATERAAVSWHEVVCVGLLEPWLTLAGEPGRALGLLIPWAAHLAEMTGWSVAHAFGLRDLAAGGLARPVTAAADGLLFSSPNEDRLVIHLGEELYLHWLPRQGSWSAIRGTLVLPGLGLLDRLTAALTGGRENADRSGHLAVQGRMLPDLLARWQAHPALLSQESRALMRSAFAHDWVRAVAELARQRNWSAFDVLCTACHWLADNLAGALARLQLPAPCLRMIVTGHGCRNGFLWQLLLDKLRPASLETSDPFGLPADSAQAARAALLAAFLLDQVPASVPRVTGSSGPRLLGQWTPGSLSNWARCLHWMTLGCEPLVWDEA
ncbi:Anhydro-N-acetylmuramic acid kinase [bacterium HR36]|nr:Anhydro-N-acetylmuramic acid kinase [bacterium HR36]